MGIPRKNILDLAIRELLPCRVGDQRVRVIAQVDIENQVGMNAARLRIADLLHRALTESA